MFDDAPAKVEIDHKYTSGLVCPYCGYEQSDSWESADSSNDDECGECGKHFSYDSQTERYFTTRKVPCLNGEPHEWKKLTLPDYPHARRCRQCYVSEYLKVKP